MFSESVLNVARPSHQPYCKLRHASQASSPGYRAACRDGVGGATTEHFLRTNVERGIEPVRHIHWRAGKCAQSNEYKSLDDLPADGDVAVSVARSSGSIRSLARLSERCVSINMGELRDSGSKCGLLSTFRYERRRGTRRIEKRIQPDYVGRSGLHRLARSSHI